LEPTWAQARYADMLKSQFAGLTPLQIAVVSAIFILTLCGAILAALAFRWWNLRHQ
jgi:hypothetical protein